MRAILLVTGLLLAVQVHAGAGQTDLDQLMAEVLAKPGLQVDAKDLLVVLV